MWLLGSGSVNFDSYINILRKSKFLDQRIKDTDLYNECYGEYIINKHHNCDCGISAPDIFLFESKSFVTDDLEIRREVVSRKVIQMKENYCLTYSEVRKFNIKHNVVSIDIEIEFLLGEKIKISAYKTNYGIILKAQHYKVSDIDDSYELYAHMPTIAVEDFHLIPFGEIFVGCYPETVQMFEDYYSGHLYPQKVLKK